MGRGLLAACASLTTLFACAPDEAGRHGGVRVMPPPSLVTSEFGEDKVFEVRLDYEPVADVIIPLQALPVQEGVVEPDQLVFTPENWTKAQTFVVRGVDDAADDGLRTISVILGDLISEDPVYSGLSLVDYEIKNYDIEVDVIAFNPDKPDEEPNDIIFERVELPDGTLGPLGTRVAVAPTDEVREGTTLTIEVALVNAAIGNEFQASLHPTEQVDTVQLHFTPENWQEAQIVDVRSIDDSFAETPGPLPLRFDIITDDPVYNFASMADIELDQIDNEIPGITASDQISVVEGSSGTITVALHTPPQGAITMSFASANPSDVQIMGDSTLTFTAEDFSHTLTVQSVENYVDEASVRTVVVNPTVVDVTDPVYEGQNANPANVLIYDNDSSGGGGGGGGRDIVDVQENFGALN